MPSELLRVDHVVGHVHVQIVGVFMDPAMPLVLLESQGLGELKLDLLESLRSEFGLVLGPEANYEMIGFLSGGSSVERLGVGDFTDGQLVVVAGPTAGAPAHERFFINMVGRMDVPSQPSVVIVFNLPGNTPTNHSFAVLYSDFRNEGFHFALSCLDLPKHMAHLWV